MPRQTGATLAMVQRIPPEGGTIIVHSHPMRRYLSQMIQNLRPEMDLRTKIVVIERTPDLDRLRGLRGFIEVDHAVHERISDTGLLAALNIMVAEMRSRSAQPCL